MRVLCPCLFSLIPCRDACAPWENTECVFVTVNLAPSQQKASHSEACYYCSIQATCNSIHHCFTLRRRFRNRLNFLPLCWNNQQVVSRLSVSLQEPTASSTYSKKSTSFKAKKGLPTSEKKQVPTYNMTFLLICLFC